MLLGCRLGLLAQELPELQSLKKNPPGGPGLDPLCLAEQRNNLQQQRGPGQVSLTYHFLDNSRTSFQASQVAQMVKNLPAMLKT